MPSQLWADAGRGCAVKAILVGGRGWDCNQFLLKDSKSNQFDLVDAGHGLDFDNVLRQIAPHIDVKRIRCVAITHEHLDHVNGLPRWQDLGAEIVTSPVTAHKLLAGFDPTSESFGMKICQLAVDRVVEEGDRVMLGGEEFEAILSPGHSPGSVCYWNAASGTLFAGDVLFADGGIGRFDFPDSNLAHHVESILRLEKLPVRVLHCGHGASVEGEGAARSVKGSVAHVRSYA